MLRSRAKSYNIHQAKTHLSKLIEQVEQGVDVTIARAGVPVARIVPIRSEERVRPLGTEVGRFTIPEDFDAPLPGAVLRAFEK
jgi:prevent-host-death family protein